MSLTMIEQLEEIQAEGSSLTDILEFDSSRSAAHLLDGANRPADELLNSFTAHDFEKKEERDALESTEAILSVTDVDRTATDKDSELAPALSLYLHEIGCIPRLTAKEEMRLALLAQQGSLDHHILYLQYHKTITILISEIERANCAYNLFTLSKKYSKLDVGLFFARHARAMRAATLLHWGEER